MENVEQMNEKKHRGEIVDKVVRQSGFALNRLAKRLKISRNTLYNRFKDPELKDDFILDVGDIINYDFKRHFPDLKREDEEDDEDRFIGGNQVYLDKETVKMLELGKKYMVLLERYNDLLGILVKLANTNEMNVLRKEIARLLEENLDPENPE